MAVAEGLPQFSDTDLPEGRTVEEVAANRYTEDALRKHKIDGLTLALRTRLIALGLVAILLVYVNPVIEVLYYHVLLLLFAVNGWVLRRVGQVGRSGVELLVIFFDLALLTFALLFPNPFDSTDWPTPVILRFGNFIYFFIFLAMGTLAFSWRTLMAIGNWTAALWAIGVTGIWYFGHQDPELGAAIIEALGADPRLVELFDPNALNLDIRVQEITVFLIVAYALAISTRRFNRLLLSNAALERERGNLSRYFSPNVVDELSRNDEPLKQIRQHDVAVLFVDIIGFSGFAADRSPEAVISTLREFHSRMEVAVFGAGGTLDKYLGDGLMATFGTPMPGEKDASAALACARTMVSELHLWNAARAARGEPQLRAGIGIHYGPVVLGSIGANRMEFAVIGNTVNVTSRIEGLCRQLNASLTLSVQAHARIVHEGAHAEIADFKLSDPQAIRGFDAPVGAWYLPRPSGPAEA